MPWVLGNASIYFIDGVAFNFFKKGKELAIKQKPTPCEFHHSLPLRANCLVKQYYYNLASGFLLKIKTSVIK